MTERSPFSQKLSEESRANVLACLGVTAAKDSPELTAYLNYLQAELRGAERLKPRSTIQTHDDATQRFELLKSHPRTSKSDIAKLGPSPPNFTDLDVLVRVFLVTACQSPGTAGGGVTNPSWRGYETLEDYVNRVYPQRPPSGDGEWETVEAGKLMASYLTSEGRMKIKWTDRLSDHLAIAPGPDWKTVHLFRFPLYLKSCLENLQSLDTESRQVCHKCLER